MIPIMTTIPAICIDVKPQNKDDDEVVEESLDRWCLDLALCRESCIKSPPLSWCIGFRLRIGLGLEEL